MLVFAVPEDLDKLLEDGCLAAVAALCKLGRVMIVAVDLTIMLVIAILGAKDGWAKRAGEVVHMVLAL